MSGDEVFEIWAPRDGMGEMSWSNWAKPVLFAQMNEVLVNASGVPSFLQVPLPTIAPGTAVVVDLPGDSAVVVGLELARHGFRPVPLYNGIADGQAPPLEDATEIATAVIDAWPVVQALAGGAAVLRTLAIPPDAPPAFLLDFHRRLGQRSPAPGLLDNRWLCFPTDFPSARVLLDRGITQAVIITPGAAEPATDLSHALLRWQEAGIAIQVLPLVTGVVTPVTVSRPGMSRAAWYQVLTSLGLRRSLLGGYGGRVPQPSSG